MPVSASLWAPSRAFTGVRAFRVVIAVLLCFYYADLLATLPGVIGADGLHDGRAQAWLALDAARVQALCIAGMLLAVAVALGTKARVGAVVLLAITVTLQRAAFATSTLDDVVLAIASFWLCLLPLEPPRRAAWVEGRAASLCALHLMFVQLDVGLWQAFAPAWPDFGAALGLVFIGLAVALLAPSAIVRGTAMVGLTALHVALAVHGTTGLSFAHAVLASMPCLMLGAAPASGEEPPHAMQPWNAASVLGAVVIALTLLWRGALAQQAVEPLAASQRLLADFGLVPLAAPGYPETSLAIHVRGDDGTLRDVALVDNERARRLIAQLFGRGPERDAVREHVVRELIARSCAAGTASGTLTVSDGARQTELAWFECARGGAAARVVLLSERN